MYPDYTKMINEFIKPVVMLYMFIFVLMVTAIGLQLWKDRAKIEKKLGEKTIKWLLEEDK